MKLALWLLPVAVGGFLGAVLLVRSSDEPVIAKARKARPAAESAEDPPKPGIVRETVVQLFEVAPGPERSRTLVDRLRENLASMSDEEILHARMKLSRFLEENPEAITELLDLFEKEPDEDVLALIAEVIGADAAAMANPAVLETMVRLAESSRVAAARGGALQVLMHLPRLDAKATDTVIRLARAEAEHRDLRMSAIATAAAWMQDHPDSAAPLGRALLGVAKASGDDEIRGHAIQAVALQSRPAEADVVEAAAGFLRDANPQNRALAAMALGNATPETRAHAVDHLQAAIGAEKSPDFQRQLLVHLVRAAGSEAPEALERVAARSPRLAADVQDYVEILKAERDPAKVFELKQRRDFARGVVGGADDHTD